MSENYNVSDYGIFDNAVSTTSKVSEELNVSKTTIDECKTNLSNESVFMGPLCDEAVNGFSTSSANITQALDNFSKISSYITETSSKYKAGDEAASNTVLRIDSGKISTSTVSNVSTGNETKDKVYNYLASQGFNNAAICGIMANIQHESSFNTQALGDGGTSYGICQWHNCRWTNLKNYCSSNNLDASSLDGQLSYLVHELKSSYPGVYNTLQNVPNTKEGAYQAASKWTTDYEIPANKENVAVTRGNTAQGDYWNTYGN